MYIYFYISLYSQEIVVPSQPHCMLMFNDKLCIGYQSGFSLFNVYLDEMERSELSTLCHTTDCDEIQGMYMYCTCTYKFIKQLVYSSVNLLPNWH